MTNHAVGIGTCTQCMTIPSYLHSEMHLHKFPDQTEFQSWVVNFRTEVCEKNEESRAPIAVDQEIEETSSVKDLINPKSIAVKDFSDYEELDLMMAEELKCCTTLFIWSTKLPSVEPRQNARGKILTPNGGLETVVSGRQLGVVQEETPVVFYSRMPRETVRQRGKKMEDARKSRLEQAYSSVPEVKKQIDGKSLDSLKASPATKA